MKRLLCFLLATFWGGVAFAALNPTEWRFRQEISISASGPVYRVEIPAETLDATRPDLSDLRIIDNSGHEIPYLLDQPVPHAESILRPKEFRAEITPAETRLFITTGTGVALNGITLELPPHLNFIKAVRIEASHDQRNWEPLTSGYPIFSFPAGPSKLRISFANGTWPFLRVTVDDSRTPPVPFIGANLNVSGSQAPVAAVPITVKSRDETPGVTRIALDVSASNLTIASLRIETPEPLFNRAVSVAAPEVSGDTIDEKTLGTAMIYRVDLNGKTEAGLNIPFEAQIRGREIVLIIENGDSPPLAITAVTADRRVARLLFVAPKPGASYSLLLGNSQCATPRYDLEHVSEQLRNAVAIDADLSAIATNPGYEPILPPGVSAGARLDLSDWKFRRPIQSAKTGVQEWEVDQDLLAQAASDLSDVRVVRGQTQLPYFVERTSIWRAVGPRTTLVPNRDRPSLSRWSLKLPRTRLPITRLTCTSTSPLFERQVRLWEELEDERGDKYPHELGRATWRRLPKDSAREFAVQFDAMPQSDTLLLETDNGDNAAIELHDFRSYYRATRLIFTTTAMEPLWLYYGNSSAPAPRYDATLIGDQLLRETRTNATVGRVEYLQSSGERVTESLSGATRYIFWAVLALIVVALLLLIARLLPKVA